MSEAEELELLELEAEAEAAQPAPEAPKPGVLSRAVGWVGKQMERVPGAIKGAVQAYQTGDPNQAANMALQGFKDPASVQSSEQMMGRFGADAAMTKPQVKTPPPDAQTQWNSLGNVPDPIKRSMLGWEPGKSDTTYTSNAKELGQGFDALAPTGLEFLPPMFKGLAKGTGKTLEKAGELNARGALKPSVALRRGPNPFNESNLFKKYPDLNGGDLASIRGKGATLEKIQGFHETLGDKADALLESMPKVDLHSAVNEARTSLGDAINQGLYQADAEKIKGMLDMWENSAKRLTPDVSYGWLEKQGVEGKVAKNWRTSLSDAARYDKPETNDGARIVAATIREALNDQLSKISPEFRAIDKQFSETIPLRNAIADASGREGNKYPIGIRSAMMLANPASIPVKAAEMALIEGTSRYIPAIATKRAGQAASAASRIPIPQGLPVGRYIRGQQEER